MQPADLLREARRRSGLSVRAAALRCDVPRATWAAWESGATSPTVRRLLEVLAVLGLELRAVARRSEPAGEAAVAQHLTRSLTVRARAALADQLETTLVACRREPRLLTGPAAIGVWLPHVRARGPLPLPRPPDRPGLVELRLSGQYKPPAYAYVPTPGALVADGHASQWPGLETSARLMRQRAPRDAAGRRLPPHRDPDEQREIRDLAQTLTWGGLTRFPVSDADSRAWRLDAPATLEEVLAWQRLPPRHVPPQARRR